MLFQKQKDDNPKTNYNAYSVEMNETDDDNDDISLKCYVHEKRMKRYHLGHFCILYKNG